MNHLELRSSVKVEIDEVVAAVNDLETPELEVFFDKIASIVAARKKDQPLQEAELLAKIKVPALSAHDQSEYERLYQKLQKETINEQEYEQLSDLLQQVEQRGVERLKQLVELSKLRNTTLPAVMAELNIENVTPDLHV